VPTLLGVAAQEDDRRDGDESCGEGNEDAGLDALERPPMDAEPALEVAHARSQGRGLRSLVIGR